MDDDWESLIPTDAQFRAIAQAWIDAVEVGEQPYDDEERDNLALEADIIATALPMAAVSRGIATQTCEAVQMQVLGEAVRLWSQDAGISMAAAFKRLREWIDEFTGG